MNTPTIDLPYHLTPDNLPTENLPTSTLSQKSILNLLNTTTSLQHLKQTHPLILKTNLFQDHFIAGALVKSYANPYLASFSTAMEVFNVLAACANVGALKQGKWIHTYMRKNSILVDDMLESALLDMYAKCGRLDLEWEVFEIMKLKEISSWNAMIGGLAMHGRADDAIELFLKMPSKNLKPNAITFVGILNACAHAGLVDEGLECSNRMEEAFGAEPTVEHYGCVVC